MIKLTVAGMTCGHCVAAVTRAVSEVPSVESVSVDLERGEVTVGGHPDSAAVRKAILEEGYEVRSPA